MPRLPQYNSSRNMTSKVLAPTENSAGVDTAPLNLLSQMATQWKKASDTMQLTHGKTAWDTGTAEILAKAQQDPDYNNSQTYMDDLKKVKDSALEGFTNKGLQKTFALELDRDLQLGYLKIDNIYKKKQVNYHKNVTLPGLVDNWVGKKAAGHNPQLDSELQSVIDAQVASGFISPAEGDKMFKDAAFRAASLAIYNNPKGFDKKLLENLSPEEKAKLGGNLTSRLKAVEAQEKWEQKMTYTKGALTASEAILSKSLTPEMVRGLMKSGEMDSLTGSIFYNLAMKKTFTGEDMSEDQKFKPDFFLSQLDEVLDDKTEALNVLKTVTNAYGRGELGYNQYAYFVGEVSKKFEAEKKGETSGNRFMRGLIQSIRKHIPIAQLNDITTNFIERIQKEKPNDKRTEEILIDEIYSQKDISKDKFGFVIGEERNGYTYIGDNKWQK
jgi:hypothetical protein